MFKQKLSLLILLLALPAFACQLSGGEEATAEPAPTAEVADADPTDEPVADPTDEPVADPTDEPAADPTDEPAPDPTDEPAADPTPEPTTPDSSDFVTYESTDIGLTVQYPSDWILEEDGGGFISVVSDEEILDADTFSEGAGLILVADPSLGLLSAEEILNLFTADEEIVAGLVETEAPQAIIINGQSAFRGRYTGNLDGMDVNTTMTAITSGGAGAVAIGITPPTGSEDLEVILDQIVDTLVLAKPPEPTSAGSIGIGGIVSGSIVDGDNASWDILVDAGDTVDITVIPAGDDFDLVVDVVDELGLSILPDGEVDDSFGEEFIGGVVFENAGTYQIIVRGFAGAEGDYELSVTPAGTTTTTPNSSDGGELSFESPVAGSLGSDETANYNVTLVGGTPVTIVAASDNDDGDMVISIYDADGNLLEQTDDTVFEPEVAVFVPAADGTYTIGIEEFFDEAIDYTVTLTAGGEAAAPPTTTNGGALLLDAPLSSSLGSDETTNFTVDLIGGTPVTIIVASENDDGDMVVSIYNADGTLLQQTDDTIFSPETVAFTPPADGTYTIGVEEFFDEAINYTITISSDGSSSGNDSNTGTFNTDVVVPADLIAVQESSSLAAGTSADYSIIVNPYQLFTVLVTTEGDFDAVVEVYNPSGGLVQEQDNSFTEEELIIIPEEAGDYTITVRGFDNTALDYDVTVSYGGPGGAGLTGSILRASDTLDAGDSHAFPFFSLGEGVIAAIVEPDGFDVIIGLSDDNTEERLNEVDESFGYERFSATTPSEGDYFVFVEGFDAEEDTGDYEIILVGGPEVAFELAGGDIVNGVFGESGLLGYSFQGLAGDTLIVTASPTADLDLVVSIEPSEGDPYVSADEFFAGGTEVATYTFAADETVFIFLTGFDDAVGSLEMAIEIE